MTSSAVTIPGPWQHRHVAANGARFHVAECPAASSDAPLVLLLHGFPEFWWSWRAQLPTIAAAGYRAAAMDLRGYGGSDKTPRGYDPMTLARDVSGVVKALGARQAVVVGHGWGGYVGWASAALHPREVRALCAVSAPHPRIMLRALWSRQRLGALQHVLAMQVPMLPERRLADPTSGFLRNHLTAWSSGASAFPDDAAVATYERALRLWPAPHCALEYHRWLFRSRMRADGREFRRAMEQPVLQPVATVHGHDDPALPAATVAQSAAHVGDAYLNSVLGSAGHFPHEEQPAAFNEVLLAWLRTVS